MPAAATSKAAASERMSRVDTAWLRMDNDANLMMIVGVWLLRPRLTVADARERIEAMLLKYPRFHQRVQEDVITGASWVDDKNFDIAQHVVAEKLRKKRGEPPT